MNLYYAYIGEEVVGPISMNDLLEMERTQALDPATPVKGEADADWSEWAKVRRASPPVLPIPEAKTPLLKRDISISLAISNSATEKRDVARISTAYPLARKLLAGVAWLGAIAAGVVWLFAIDAASGGEVGMPAWIVIWMAIAATLSAVGTWALTLVGHAVLDLADCALRRE